MPKAGEQLHIDPHHRASLRNRGTTDRARLRGARTSHALCLGCQAHYLTPQRTDRF